MQEAVGIDVELLNEIQVKILEVYSVRALSCAEPLLESSYTLCASSMETALYKATNHLLDDLSRNARLLGTPERLKSGQTIRIRQPYSKAWPLDISKEARVCMRHKSQCLRISHQNCKKRHPFSHPRAWADNLQEK